MTARQPPRVRLRRRLRVVHRYLGLTVGLYLAVIATTGSLLVFKSEIDSHSLHAYVTPFGPHASLSIAPSHPLLAVQEALYIRYGADAARHFTTYQLSTAPGVLYTTTGMVAGKSVTLTIDPGSGQIVRETVAASPLDGIEDLHVHLLRGAAGFAANGWVALGAAALLVSGLVMYLPPKKPELRLGDFHALLGVVTLLLLLVNTLTGAALVFNDPVEHAVYRVTGTPPHPGPAVATAAAMSKIPTSDALLDAARAAAPDADAVFVTLPTRPQQAFYCLLQKPSGILPYISVYVHPQTGAILRVDRDDHAPAGRRIMGSVPALHAGTWGGLPIKILYSAVGLSPLALYISGGWLTLRRFRAHRRRPSRAVQ